MCILASITAALLCWPLLAVLALRRTDRLASHPVLFAKTSHLFLDEYLAVTLIALGVNQLLAILWPHPRPFMMALGHTFIAHASDSSFPSDDSTVFAGIGLTFVLSGCRVAVGCWLGRAAVGLSRRAIGVSRNHSALASVRCGAFFLGQRHLSDNAGATNRDGLDSPLAVGMARVDARALYRYCHRHGGDDS